MKPRSSLSRLFAFLTTVLLSLALWGCGGGSSTPSNALGGTAAVGYPIVGGTVTVTCAGGSTLTTTTGSNGAWSVSLSGQTLPCAVRIAGGTINGVPNTQNYHSIALTLGTVNITPLTDLMVAYLTGSNPSTWFSGLGASSFSSINSAALESALNALRTQLGLTTALNGMHPITSSFNATTGDRMDDVLEALRAAIAKAYGSGNYSGLLDSARYQFGEFGTSFSTLFGTAFASTATGSGSGGSGGSGGGGSSSLSCDTAAFGGGSPVVPNSTQLSAYARTYNATGGSGSASLVLSSSGAVTYRGSPVTVASMCMVDVGTEQEMLVIHWGTRTLAGAGAFYDNHVDLFSDGSLAGYVNEEIISLIVGGGGN